MQDLSPDIIGTNPTYPKIMDHSWLTPDPQSYDNYPSDNNPVRIGPKLADLWNHNPNKGISVVPNLTVQPLGCGCRNAEDQVSEVVREAKKAMMMGLSGKSLADHLRSRFVPGDIVAAKESLTKLAEEQGLLGSVYIDASAFNSTREAEQFMNQHKNRLAQDILVNESKLTPGAVMVLASKFRKNVISKVVYDQDIFDKYRNHLIARGDIPANFVVNSKETLQQAFLYKEPVAEVTKKAEEAKLDKESTLKVMLDVASKKAGQKKEAEDDLIFRKILPILEFTRSQVVKGKDASGLKEMLRKKYATEDINDSAKYLGIVVAEINHGSFTPEIIQTKVEAGELSEYVGEQLIKLAKKYPMTGQLYVIEESVKPFGVQGTFHTPLSSTSVLSMEGQNAVEALRKGTDLDCVKANLLSKMSAEEADKILVEAVYAFNNTAAGAVANAPEKKADVIMIEDAPNRDTLPDLATTASQIKDLENFYEGSGNLDVEVNAGFKSEKIDVSNLESKSGMDSAL